ncbi:MAG: lipopolysaccharide biosynthesis protein [Steroidobacteraceae bacterium]
MSVKKNLIANYLGQAWRGITAVIFVPVFIRFLGLESYGLIAVFTILQSSLGFLDMGMRPALVREMARFTAGQHTVQSIRNLLRSVEIIGVVLALTFAVGIALASGWLATHWFSARSVSPQTIRSSLCLMGVVVGLHFIENIYASTLTGLQRQVTDNLITMGAATLRAVGAIAVLAWVSPTIQAFFVWQGAISLITVAVYVKAVYGSLPSPAERPTLSFAAVANIWRFASGMTLMSILAFLLTQTDKILLSRLLTLTQFSYYALASAVASSLYLLTGPITNAVYPKFTELVESDDGDSLNATYHMAAQLVTVTMGGAALVLIAFAQQILLLWTGNPSLSRQTAPLLSILTLGTLLHGFMWIPYQMQLAHGWTSLGVKINAVAVATLVPLLIWLVPRYGALSAAWAWVGLNSGYLLLEIYFMHRRIIPREKGRWYLVDLLAPIGAGGLVAALFRWLLPGDLGKLPEFTALILIATVVVAAGALAAPAVRSSLIAQFFVILSAVRGRREAP